MSFLAGDITPSVSAAIVLSVSEHLTADWRWVFGVRLDTGPFDDVDNLARLLIGKSSSSSVSLTNVLLVMVSLLFISSTYVFGLRHRGVLDGAMCSSVCSGGT